MLSFRLMKYLYVLFAVLFCVQSPSIAHADGCQHPVLEEYYATWCPHCRDDIPVLNAIERDFRKKGLTVLRFDRSNVDMQFPTFHYYCGDIDETRVGFQSYDAIVKWIWTKDLAQ